MDMKEEGPFYIITDCCLWEQNKQNKTFHPHAVEIVNLETGQTHYLKSGSKIQIAEGFMTESRDQKSYNKIGNSSSSEKEVK